MDKKTVKLFDSELKVMGVLWKEGDTPAKQIEKLKQIVADLTPAGFMSACLIVFVIVGLFATSAASSTGRGHNDMPAARDPQTNGRDPAADGRNTMSITHESADILCYEDGSPLKLYWNFPDGSAESSFEQIVRTKENILPDQTESKKEDLEEYRL